MKQRILVVLLACAAVTVSSPQPARAQVDISANVDIQIGATSDFYQPLQSYGTWVDLPQYGRCWEPRGVEADWQPYTVGHWEWTDAGWYWNSDEPWGWACFHYGSWTHDARVGWCWIPGTDWAPAWVTWRDSDDYIGWAPCGPGQSVLAPSFFTFCAVHDFGNHFSRRNLIINNTTIINRTKVVKNFQRQTVDFNGHQRTIFANRGPGVDSIQRATGHNFTPRPVRDVVRESRQPDRVRQGNNDRPNARPDQRPGEQPRRDATPSPTGRDQQRNYQQQQQQQNRQTQEQQNRDRQLQQQRQEQQQQQQRPLAPTGRNDVKPAQPENRPTPEQQNRERQNTENRQREIQQQQKQQRDATPAQARPLAPTGRDEVKPAQPEHKDVTPNRPQEVPKPTPPAEQRREVPTPAQRPPTERTLPPTGRDDGHAPSAQRPPTQAPAEKPAARPAEPAHPATPAVPHQDGRDGKRDGNQQ